MKRIGVRAHAGWKCVRVVQHMAEHLLAGDMLAPCYINDDTLLGSIWRTPSAPPLCATSWQARFLLLFI